MTKEEQRKKHAALLDTDGYRLPNMKRLSIGCMKLL